MFLHKMSSFHTPTDSCVIFFHVLLFVVFFTVTPDKPALLLHIYVCVRRLPVPSGVVQCAAGSHRLKVIDAPSHEGNGGPEDGEDPDDAAHGQRGAPEELLS